ncbi:TPA: glutathione S-transferase, partial [Vibrio vulnificus]
EFCGESGLRKVGLGGTHPLTQRYTFICSYLESECFQIY